MFVKIASFFNSGSMKTCIAEFLSYCIVGKNLSSETVKAYSVDLKQFNLFLNSIRFNGSIVDIDKNILKKYISELSQFSPKTIKRKLATLKVFFNYLEFEESIENNPFRKVKASVKIPKQLPEVMSLTEVGSILTAANNNMALQKTDRSRYRYREALRDMAILELLFATGIRVSELCNLEFSNIRNDFSVIIVKGKGNKERSIPVPTESVKNVLKQYYSNFSTEIDSARTFFVNRLKKPLSTQSVRFMVKKYAKNAKLKRNITPHVFRHSYATLLLEEGLDIRYIQNLLGHSSINTTQIYAHVNDKKKQEFINAKHPRNLINI